MTRRSEIIYQFVKAYIDLNGYAPALREIAVACNLTGVSSVSYHLMRLQNAGRLTVARNVARGIVLTEAPDPEWAALNRMVAK